MSKTVYIAGDWDHDVEVVNKIVEWNCSPIHPINFTNAHDLKQARDDSLKCSIKASLYARLSQSSKFILIVGANTKSLTSGGCQWCRSYNSYNKHCMRDRNLDYSSFIEYECKKAIKLGLDILVVYNSDQVNLGLCPDSIAKHEYAEHIPFYTYQRVPLIGGWGLLRKIYNMRNIYAFLTN